MMKKILMMAFAWCFAMTMGAQQPTSPNGRLSVSTADKGLSVCYRQQQVLTIAELGYEGLSQHLELQYAGEVKTDYQMIAGKKLHCINEAREYRAELAEGL